MFWIVVGIFLLIAVAGYFVYTTAEHHELHKMRAAFEKVEHNLVSYFEREKEIISHDGVTFGEIPKEAIQGAGYAMQRIMEMLDNEEQEIDHEFINHVRKVFSDIFHGKE